MSLGIYLARVDYSHGRSVIGHFVVLVPDIVAFALAVFLLTAKPAAWNA
jgi:hypothetical protein